MEGCLVLPQRTDWILESSCWHSFFGYEVLHGAFIDLTWNLVASFGNLLDDFDKSQSLSLHFSRDEQGIRKHNNTSGTKIVQQLHQLQLTNFNRNFLTATFMPNYVQFILETCCMAAITFSESSDSVVNPVYGSQKTFKVLLAISTSPSRST